MRVQNMGMTQREDTMVVRVSFCTLQKFYKIAVTFARTSFVQCIGVGVCPSKGTLLWHFFISTLVPVPIQAAYYPAECVHSVELPVLGILFSNIE